LRRKDPPNVAVERDRLALLSFSRTFGYRLCDQWPDGTFRPARRSGPVQAILPPSVAKNFLRLLGNASALSRERSIFFRRLDQVLRYVDRVKLFRADPATDHPLLACPPCRTPIDCLS
jgi:hypothetical protein